MASILKVDDLRGKTTESTVTIANNEFVGASAGSITIPGEGGTTTTNLQQGLAKAWVCFNGTSTIAIDESFNTASLTDLGTGNYTNSFTNFMDGDNFAAFAGGDINNSNDDVRRNNRLYRTAGGFVRVVCGYNANSNTKEDWTDVYTASFGDLA